MDLEFAFDALGVDGFELFNRQTTLVFFGVLLYLGGVDQQLLVFISLHYKNYQKNAKIFPARPPHQNLSACSGSFVDV
jgi:hypothetical protein